MRRKGRRGWTIVILLLLLLTIIGIFVQRELLVVRNVEFEGEVSVPESTLMRMTGISLGTSIFSVDKEAVEAQINASGKLCLEDMQRSLPNTLILRLRERQPVAMLLHMGRIRTLDEDGFVVESADEVPDQDLIYINNMRVLECETGRQLRAQSGQTEAYSQLMRALNRQAATAYISEIDLNDLNDIRMITRAGITVKLGSSASAESKVAWMKGAVQDLERRGEGGGTLDVSSGSKADYKR